MGTERTILQDRPERAGNRPTAAPAGHRSRGSATDASDTAAHHSSFQGALRGCRSTARDSQAQSSCLSRRRDLGEPAVSMRRLATVIAVAAAHGVGIVAELEAFVVTSPSGPTPPQYGNLMTTSIFWPNETAADGTVFACTYLPTLVLANDTRLIAHGRCYTARQAAMSSECGGFHVSATARGSAAAADAASPVALGPVNLCQKHSDDGGMCQPAVSHERLLSKLTVCSTRTAAARLQV